MSRELDEACARALGWEVETRWCSRDPECGGWDECQSHYDPEFDDYSDTKWYSQQPCYREKGRVSWRVVPEFSSDPVAARLLEDEIERRGLQDKYVRALCPDYHSFEPLMPDELFALIRATPEQRARAFLEAVQG